MAWTDLFRFGRARAAPQHHAWLRTAVADAVHTQLVRATRSAFDAAETPHYTDGWRTDEPGINEALATRLTTLRARSRGLSRNNEWARRYLLQMRANVLGTAGIALQMRMLLRDGTPDAATNTKIETAWWGWGRPGVGSVGLAASWLDQQRVLLDSLARDGEILGRHSYSGPHGYQLQLLDPAILDVQLRRDWQGRRVRMGVEIDDAGAPVAYWLQGTRAGDDVHSFAVGRHVRVPASEILHAFVAEEPGQLRGYPRLTVGAQRLWLLQDFERSAAVASSNAAKRVGFFTTPTGEAPAGFGDTVVHAVMEQAKADGRTLSADELRALEESARRFTTTVPGQYDTLPEGTQYQPNTSDYPHVVYGEYTRECLRGWTAGLGMSHATLGNNLEAVNYSSARVGILDEREQYRLDQAFLVEHVHEVVFAQWLPRALLTVPALRTLPYDRLPEYLAATTWQPRRWHWIDPAKEAAAAETNLRLRLTSRRRLILERGEDPDEIFTEIATEEQQFGPPEGAASAAADAAAAADAQEQASPPPRALAPARGGR